MHVRLSRATDLSEDQVDAMVEGFVDGTYPRGDLPSQPGFRGYSAAADRDNGRVCVMSVWEDEHTCNQSRRVADRARAERLKGVRTDPIVDEQELVLWRLGPSVGEGYIRLSRVAGLVEKRAQEMVETFADNATDVEELPGFMGYLLAADTATGKVTSISQWRTRDDLEASERVAAAARERRFGELKPQRNPIIDHYEIVAVQLAPEGTISG